MTDQKSEKKVHITCQCDASNFFVGEQCFHIFCYVCGKPIQKKEINDEEYAQMQQKERDEKDKKGEVDKKDEAEKEKNSEKSKEIGGGSSDVEEKFDLCEKDLSKDFFSIDTWCYRYWAYINKFGKLMEVFHIDQIELKEVIFLRKGAYRKAVLIPESVPNRHAAFSKELERLIKLFFKDRAEYSSVSRRCSEVTEQKFSVYVILQQKYLKDNKERQQLEQAYLEDASEFRRLIDSCNDDFRKKQAVRYSFLRRYWQYVQEDYVLFRELLKKEAENREKFDLGEAGVLCKGDEEIDEVFDDDDENEIAIVEDELEEEFNFLNMILSIVILILGGLVVVEVLIHLIFEDLGIWVRLVVAVGYFVLLVVLFFVYERFTSPYVVISKPSEVEKYSKIFDELWSEAESIHEAEKDKKNGDLEVTKEVLSDSEGDKELGEK